MLIYLIHIVFKLIYFVIIVAVLLSWIPIFDARKEPVATINRLYEAIMKPFKAVIPPIGMIDISPLIAIILLNIIEQLLYRILS